MYIKTAYSLYSLFSIFLIVVQIAWAARGSGWKGLAPRLFFLLRPLKPVDHSSTLALLAPLTLAVLLVLWQVGDPTVAVSSTTAADHVLAVERGR